MKSVNPATEAIIKEYSAIDADQANKAIDNAQNAFLAWRKTTFKTRAQHIISVANTLQKNQQHYAQLMTEEMGKPVKQAKAEIEKCIWVCKYYAKNAEHFLTDETIETDAQKSFITYQPLGVILSVMPWNFPFWQVFRFAVPALMAGNAVALKHANNVCGCALAIEESFNSLPENTFKTLLLPARGVENIIKHPHIRAVTLTGSKPAGSAVAKIAGQAIKKTVLELGGNDAYIVLKDADLDETVNACVTSRVINSGQSCIAAKRFIVVEDIYDTFMEKFTRHMASLIMGDPHNNTTDIGPQATETLRSELHNQVQKSIEHGAICVLGGEIPKTKGFFYPPTILTNVKPGMPAYNEELFGPVASIIKANDENNAIDIANDSPFGLGAAIFTKNREKGTEIARNDIESGTCFVNDFVKSDPRLPFGGIKESGFGRELSQHGIREFVNIKTVSVK